MNKRHTQVFKYYTIKKKKILHNLVDQTGFYNERVKPWGIIEQYGEGT